MIVIEMEGIQISTSVHDLESIFENIECKFISLFNFSNKLGVSQIKFD